MKPFNVGCQYCIAALLVLACARSGRDSAARRDNPASEGAPNISSAKMKSAPETLSDSEIRQAVIAELFRAPHVRSGTILVGCDKGVVELTGSVDNLLAKQRAVAIAESVRGVLSVSDRIRVEPSVRSDAEVTRDVENALRYDPAAEAYQVKTAATAGVVRLTGTVDSWQERQLAERLARGVRGVKAVQNDITVNPLKHRTDTEIQRDVESRLRWDALVDDGMVHVDVNDGVARLSGSVGSAAEKRAAYFGAWVTGVRNVDVSGLKVEPSVADKNLRAPKYGHKSDAEIKTALQRALLYDPRVKSFNVDIDVKNATAVLKGKVSSVKARLAAEALAWHTVGVEEVKDELEVAPRKPVADHELAKRLEAALKADAALDPAGIRVAVKDGRATLSGKVATTFQSAEAADVAGSLEGVKSISNELTVASPELAFVWQPLVYPFGPYVENWRYVAQKPGPSDAELARNIEQRLKWSPFVDAKQIHVEVRDGKVTLTGTVESSRARRAAAENAYEAGASEVDNRVKAG